MWRSIIRGVLGSLLLSSEATTIAPICNGFIAWRRRGRRKPPGVVYKGASVHIPHRHTKCTKVIEQSSSMDMRCSRIHIGEKELVPAEVPSSRLTSRTTMTSCLFPFAGDSTNSGTRPLGDGTVQQRVEHGGVFPHQWTLLHSLLPHQCRLVIQSQSALFQR